MNIGTGIIAVIAAGGIAFLLNKIFTQKIENRRQRLGLQVAAYIGCFLLAILFVLFGSLKTILNNVIDEKITYVEQELNRLVPDANILETNIDTAELVSVFNGLHNIIESDSEKHGYLETAVLNIFVGKIKDYVYLAENQVTGLAKIADENGFVTIKSVLFHIKEQCLDGLSPVFALFQTITDILLVIYIIVYICIAVYFKKGGGSYNKSIVFGDGAAGVERGMDDRQI
jgi:succinate dehydrogenase hydrophobic anchor subunit